MSSPKYEIMLLAHWNKFNGFVICLLVQRHLSTHLKAEFKTVGPKLYIKKIENELDLIVADKVRPLDFQQYDGDLVHCVIEVKKKGMMSRKAEDDLNS